MGYRDNRAARDDRYEEPDDDGLIDDLGGDRYADEYDDGYDDYDDYENDDDPARTGPAYIGGGTDDDPPRTGRKRRRRGIKWLAALAVLALLAGGSYFGARELLGFGFDDYEGTGNRDVLLHVEEGDSTRTIATKLEELDVVASSAAFVSASEDDQRVLAIQPGYYVVKAQASGESTVETLVEPDARVGQVEIRAGMRLSDRGRGENEQPGVMSLLSQASCADMNGESTCVGVEELQQTVESTDLAELGVPEWAAEPAQERDPAHRLEGLISPGVYDVEPGWNAEQILTEVLSSSATRMEAAGLPDVAGITGYTPYEVLTVASIIEVEGVENDFGKIARVIYNRIDQDMPLQMDSTINYTQPDPTIRTQAGWRQQRGPYNTYLNQGLTPTPVGAPSTEAITAAEDPDDGPWTYFVVCEHNGLSCFSDNHAEHQDNARQAQEDGVY
ncbi:hypothetical protein BJF85_25645 [Saccharomonospora sp. CUA-673]|uniref:endolytic transglycosylase MltG n=1 Tax=Saccharomonospora sp. CUA-673 TaxID=1904969 RepID=UPI00096516A5|nr:endolytic transglycosylase MltG [Saccharomonospora sp. CUA-673]OLT39540.1 hypothetical protein BJF85_25645 [Saccharomonospora sp. CUA-673]